MTFLDTDVPLDGTPFSHQDMNTAREVWRRLDVHYDLGWIQHPRGPLGLDWVANTKDAACRLIHVAQLLHGLHGNITKKSVPVLRRKVRELVEAKSARAFEEPRQFQELLTELEVTKLISQRASPVALEPFVPEGVKQDRVPRSPDLAVRLPDGWVAFEVTVLYVEQLDMWDRQVRQFRKVIREKIDRRGIVRDIELKIPLRFDGAEISLLTRRSVFEKIMEQDTGRIVVPFSSGDASIEWRPLSVFSSLPDLKTLPIDLRAFATTGGGALRSGAAIRWSPIADPPVLQRMALASLRNTLQAKRRQFPGDVEYVLVVKLGHHRLPPDGILSLVSTRIWPNSIYAWVTGLMVYRSPLQGCTQSTGPWGETSLNPNARKGPSLSLTALLEGAAQFHQ